MVSNNGAVLLNVLIFIAGDFYAAIEEPAIYGLLPSLEGLNILDIGCGFGKFVSFCSEN